MVCLLNLLSRFVLSLCIDGWCMSYGAATLELREDLAKAHLRNVVTAMAVETAARSQQNNLFQLFLSMVADATIARPPCSASGGHGEVCVQNHTQHGHPGNCPIHHDDPFGTQMWSFWYANVVGPLCFCLCSLTLNYN